MTSPKYYKFMYKKILYVHHAAGWGGATINLINIINALDKTEFKPTVLLLKYSSVVKNFEENGIDYCIASSKFYNRYYRYFTHSEASYVKWSNPIKFITLTIYWLLSRFYFAKKELMKFNVDIIHLNSSALTDWLAPSSCISKVVIHIQEPIRRGVLGFRYYFFRSQMNRYADKIIAISKDNADRVNIKNKTEIIFNYAEQLDVEGFNIESFSSKKILYVGGSARIKGFQTVVNALDYLEKDIKVIFAGSFIKGTNSRYKKLYRKINVNRSRELKMVQKMRHHECAIEVGLVDDIGTYLDNVALLISPFSVSHFSRPVIEAFLHKKTVVVSDVKGMEEIVTRNFNGFVIPVDDYKELAATINEVCKDPELLRQFGNNGFVEAQKLYSIENISLVINLYNNLFLNITNENIK